MGSHNGIRVAWAPIAIFPLRRQAVLALEFVRSHASTNEQNIGNSLVTFLVSLGCNGLRRYKECACPDCSRMRVTAFTPC